MVSGKITLKRVAFTQIGGSKWMGGLNYQINLLNALLAHQSHRITPVLFLGEDVEPSILERYHRIAGLVIIQSPLFNRQKNWFRLCSSMLLGIDHPALKLFKKHEIDVVFESASFYGWRFPLKVLAWIPDLQHQHMRSYFGFFTFWKRELGFRMQLLGHRHIMLSSEDAKNDFQNLYRAQPNRVHVVNFSVPVSTSNIDIEDLTVRYDLPEEFFYLPNQFWRHKNHECVVLALDIARKAGYSFTVVATGNPHDPRDPDHFAKLMALVKQLQLENNFKVLGLIPYEDVQALMVHCKALINPSRFEGWSTTVEEAKTLNIPMILSDIKVHREQAETAALFFDVNDPADLAKVLIDQQLIKNKKNISRSEIIEKSHANMAKFAENFTCLINKVIKSA